MTLSPAPTALAEALDLLAERPFVALTGAGMSTDSGIPDYRGPNSPARQPMTYGDFVSGPDAQQRYWARSHLGWSRMKRAEPNDGHRALAALEATGRMTMLITQNVDGLHGAAGSDAVELHGALARVRCLTCGAIVARAALQDRLQRDNPDLLRRAAAAAPDGDADLPERDLADFQVPACEACGGVLKPDVVLFGEHVPADVTARAWAAFDRAGGAGGALLVAGSSLAVFSGYRFVLRAAERAMPVVIINRGPTRGDPLATARIDAQVGEALPALAAALT